MIGSCGIQVDQTLIPGAAPAQLRTALCKDERSVHKNVGVIQQGELCGVAAFAQRLQPISGINPNAQTAAPRFALTVGTGADSSDNLKPQRLCTLGLAVMLADESGETLSQTDKADGQRSVFDDLADLIVRAGRFGVEPDTCPMRKGELRTRRRL